MPHTLHSLRVIVHRHNEVALDSLWRSKPWLFPSFSAAPAFGSSGALKKTHASVPSSLPASSGCAAIGLLGGRVCHLPNLIRAKLCGSPSRGTVAVFSIIDEHSDPAEALPVVLCIGINYSQFKGIKGRNSYTGPTFLVDDTGMRGHAIAAFALASQTLPQAFHLVAANFFPWISDSSWGATAKNSIEEAILMHAFGYEDPVGMMIPLINSIDPEFAVFHGAHNAAASLGGMAHRASAPPKVGRVAILCDNLSGGLKRTNAIMLP